VCRLFLTASASDILAAIDAAILAGVSGPGEVRAADGRTIRYRSLDELRAIRKDYAAIAGGATGRRFRIIGIRGGSARQ
jgi:hypothetical protein